MQPVELEESTSRRVARKLAEVYYATAAAYGQHSEKTRRAYQVLCEARLHASEGQPMQQDLPTHAVKLRKAESRRARATAMVGLAEGSLVIARDTLHKARALEPRVWGYRSRACVARLVENGEQGLLAAMEDLEHAGRNLQEAIEYCQEVSIAYRTEAQGAVEAVSKRLGLVPLPLVARAARPAPCGALVHDQARIADGPLEVHRGQSSNEHA